MRYLPNWTRVTLMGWLTFVAFPIVAFAQTPVRLPAPIEAPYPSTGATSSPLLYQLTAETLPTPTTDPLEESAPAEEIQPTEEGVEGVTIAESAPVVWYSPIHWFGPASWDTGFELGLNGTSGTSDTLSFRTGGYIKRKTDARKINLSLYHNSTRSEGVVTQNNAMFDGRHDWLFDDSQWTLFAMTQVYHDEFQAFDLNVNLNSGVGYQIADEEWVKLLARLGAGASREFGAPDDAWVPEAQFSFDFQQNITKSQKFYAKMDYFPEFESWEEYRIVTDLGVEVELSQPSNVSLKISATDRYDSTTDGVPPHNTNYSVLLLWKR